MEQGITLTLVRILGKGSGETHSQAAQRMKVTFGYKVDRKFVFKVTNTVTLYIKSHRWKKKNLTMGSIFHGAWFFR